MAAPARLYRISITGDWRWLPFDPEDREWDWVLVWWVQTNVQTFDPTEMLSMALTWSDWMEQPASPPPGKPIAHGTHVTQLTAQYPRFNIGFDLDVDQHIGAGSVSDVVPPQVSFLVLGRSETIGKQTRKWIPCCRREFMAPVIPKWSPAGPNHDVLFNWGKEALQPRPVVGFPGITMTPVIYDEANEVIHSIREVVCATWPRTQRRRVLSADRSFE